MAVVQLIGKVDGQAIIFTSEDQVHWQATVPAGLTGTFIVELRAYDEVGNESYRTGMLFVADSKTLQVMVLPMKYSISDPALSFTAYELPDRAVDQEDPPLYAFYATPCRYRVEVRPQKYVAEVMP